MKLVPIFHFISILFLDKLRVREEKVIWRKVEFTDSLLLIQGQSFACPKAALMAERGIFVTLSLDLPGQQNGSPVCPTCSLPREGKGM